jgi:hypothetical protein
MASVSEWKEEKPAQRSVVFGGARTFLFAFVHAPAWTPALRNFVTGPSRWRAAVDPGLSSGAARLNKGL